jgi:hypothetical protein
MAERPGPLKHGTDRHPQLLEHVGEKPGRFVDIVDDCVAHLRDHRRLVRCNGLSHRVEDFVESPQADGQGAQLLEIPPQHPSAGPRTTLPGISLPGFASGHGGERCQA